MSERWLKDELYQAYATIGKCLSSPKRLELLDALIQGPKSVETLAHITTMSVTNVSQHLQTLYRANMVTSHKEGNYVIYHVADGDIIQMMQALHDTAETQLIQVQEIKKAFSQLDEMTILSLPELQQRMINDEIVLIDVRPTEEFEQAHITGAISIPLEQLEEQLATLPPHRDIVAYCRGMYCLMAIKAVSLLQEKGLTAYRLQHSVHEWYAFQQEF